MSEPDFSRGDEAPAEEKSASLEATGAPVPPVPPNMMPPEAMPPEAMPLEAPDAIASGAIASRAGSGRRQFGALFQDSPLSTQVFSPDGCHQGGNRAWTDFWRTTAESWAGYNVLEDQQLALKGALPVIQRGFGGEAVIASPILYDPTESGRSGRPRWVQIFVHPLRENGDRIAEVALVHQDLTELKQSEDMLRFLTGVSTALTSSLHDETVLQNVARLAVPYLADACLVNLVAPSGYFERAAAIYANPNKGELARVLEQRCDIRLEALYGVSQVVRTGQSRLITEVSDVLLQAVSRPTEQLQMLRELNVSSYLCVPLIAHGQTLGAITLVSGPSGRHYTQLDLALAEEVARRAALAVANARLYEQAQEANRAKDEFLIIAAHELRTPITALLGYAHLLQSDKLDETQRVTSLQTVERNAWSLVQVVNEIVDISRINAGKVQIDLRPQTLPPIIEAALDSTRSAAEAKAITLQVMIDATVGIISGDASRLQQVVWQLLSNAIKFTPAGGRVTLRATATESHARIEVSDTGIGIEPQVLPHIFERFQQADSSITRSHSGMGLGLALVRYLVEMHGGRVHAYSAGEDKGATFTVELPLVVALTQEASRQMRVTRQIIDEDLSLEGLRVLAVEKDQTERELMTAGLARFGAEVRSSASTADALDALIRWNPDVLVSDMDMPGEDGYALIRQVRALSAAHGGDIPAVAVTPHMRTVDRLRSLAAGYQAHMAKPIAPDDLAAAVAGLTGRLST